MYTQPLTNTKLAESIKIAVSLLQETELADCNQLAAALQSLEVRKAIEAADVKRCNEEYNEPLREYLCKAVYALAGSSNYSMQTLGRGEMRMGCGNTWYYARYTCCSDPANRFDLITIYFGEVAIGSKRAHELGYSVDYSTNEWTKK